MVIPRDLVESINSIYEVGLERTLKMVFSAWESCDFEFPQHGAGGGWLWPRIAPILLTPCLQHWIVSVSSAFLCIATLFSLFSLYRVRNFDEKSKPRVSTYYWLTLVVTKLATLTLFISSGWKIFQAKSLDVQDVVFSLSQASTWLLFVAALFLERTRFVEVHSPLLRVLWVLNCILSSFTLLATVLRSKLSQWPETLVNDVAVAIAFPASFFLLAAVWVKSTGVVSPTSGSTEAQNGHLSEPLLSNGDGETAGGGDEKEALIPITGYESAGIISTLGFLWLNPLLKKGSQKILGVEDIPRLGKAERVEAAYAHLKAEWEKPGQEQTFLPYILIRAHWGKFALTGILGLVKFSVMYAGPLLIQRFIDFTAQKDTRWYNGCLLVGCLLLAKALEVTSDHQSSFIGNKIGVAIWSGLVSAVYQKGLRITSAARQSHGTGKIVNYMSVDARDVSEVCTRLHDLWRLPIQICLALVILYTVVGVATFAGIGTMLGIMVITLLIASKQQAYQVTIMASKDQRIKVTNEALNSMKIIKLCAWMEKFLARIEAARAVERIWISKLIYLAAISIFFLWLSPLAVSVFTFGTCVLLGIELTAGKVFTAIATFRIVQEPLRSFPQLVMEAAQAMVSIRRLQKYLDSPELDLGAVSRVPSGENSAVVVENGTFKWEPEMETPTLKDIDIRVGRESFAAIVGTVGSGKSALLSCVLGEMEKMSGRVVISGKVAYVPQTAWIQNGTIKDNILFGKPFHDTLYKETLKACSLEGDIADMIHGDQTEIGERGINLSGGQKQRVQLARAIYQDADVYLLDDIFSALDAHTGSDIFQHCIRGTLRDKTVMLVTHQVEFLHGADLILVMKDGAIVQSGKYDELTSQGTDFGALVGAHNESLESREMGDGDGSSDEEDDVVFELGEEENFSSTLGDLDCLPTSTAPLLIASSSPGGPSGGSQASTPPVGSLERLSREQSLKKRYEREGSDKFSKVGVSSKKNMLRKSSSKSSAAASASATAATTSAKLIEEEEREKGRVGADVYWAYVTKVLFGTHVIALIFIQLCWQGLQIASDFWLADSTSAKSMANFNPKRFMLVYAGLAIGSGMFVLARSLMVSFSGLRTAQRFFLDMIRCIFRAPMSFFDTTPTGRVLSRSSTDQVSVDFYIPFLYGSLLAVGFQLFGVLVVMSTVTPQMLFVIVPMGVVFVTYQHYFIATSRELTRLESVTEAPIIQHFSETISGFATVRAFGHQERFVSSNVKLVNTNMGIQFHTFGSYEWLGYRLESIGTLVLCSSALILVLLPKGLVQPEFVGLSLSYGLALNGCMFWLVTCASHVEQKMVAVERILQYTKIPSEAPLVIEGHRPEPTWPSKGSVSMKNVQMRYRPDKPLVLKGVSFTIKGGEKLGVVGKTGSGKSSIILALFRIVEPAGGKIIVDGVDISTIGLSDLRSKFSIIPQEPTLFEGNVRNNVDPLGEHSDAEIWEALEKCQLGDIVREKEEKLDFLVAENGENWSVGQRQLFCLGRVLLKKSRILVLDEATASVDTQTDIVLQKIISKEFSSSTVISIAHRIPTVMDSDKVLVLDAGMVKEFGSPSTLLDQDSSLFSALVQEYWNRSNSLHNLAAAGEVGA